jgi:hypothetical protein
MTYIMAFDADGGASVAEVSSDRQLANYLLLINSLDFNAEDNPLSMLCKMKAYSNIQPLLCVVHTGRVCTCRTRVLPEWAHHAPTSSTHDRYFIGNFSAT